MLKGGAIKYPIIEVWDKDCQSKMLVGSDHHHKLLVDKETGQIKFLNVQCMEGTGEDSCYDFISTEDDWGKEIKFGDIYELIDIQAKSLELEEKGLAEEYQQALRSLKELFEKAQGIKSENDKKFDQFKEKAFSEYFDSGFTDNDTKE